MGYSDEKARSACPRRFSICLAQRAGPPGVPSPCPGRGVGARLYENRRVSGRPVVRRIGPQENISAQASLNVMYLDPHAVFDREKP